MNPDAETVLELEMRDGLEDSSRAEESREGAAPSIKTPRADAGPCAHTGTLVGWNDSGLPEVDFPANPCDHPVPAQTTVELQAADVGGQFVLVFERGDLRKPIILGRIRAATQPSPAAGIADAASADPVDARVDGETVTLTADKEIVLRCGKASITLTRAGKVIIRGAYLLSRSSGVNRIKGGSIQLN